VNGRRMLAIAALALSGCPQIERIDDVNNGGSIPTAVQAAFDRQCNDAACHGTSPALGLSLEAANSASILEKNGVSNPDLPYVDFGNIPGSFMAHKLLPDSELMNLDITRVGARMPNIAITPEIQEDVALILGWIAGAELPGGGEGGTGDTETGETGGTTGEVEALCGIEDLHPGSTNPIVAGDGAMQIPTEIGDVLATNCGCHYIDMVNRPVADYLQGTAGQPMLISTWAEWHDMYMTNVLKSPIEESLARLDAASTLPMPPPSACDVGTGLNIAADDKALLVDWLMQGAPDGASWMGGGGSTEGGSTDGGSTEGGSTGEATGGSSSG
jgi:hypothetical protein